jgi:O-antigen ligase
MTTAPQIRDMPPRWIPGAKHAHVSAGHVARSVTYLFRVRRTLVFSAPLDPCRLSTVFVISIILLIAGLVWGTYLCMRGSLLGGCLLLLVMTCCFGVHFFQFDAGITFSLDRLLVAGLVGAYVVQRKLGQTDSKPLNAADYLLGGFFGVLIVSMLTHDWRTCGPNDVPVLQHLINGYLIPLAIYWVARQATLNQRNVTWVLYVLVAFGVYLAITGIFETLGVWSLVFPGYIADPAVGLHFGRARGPMVHAVSYGIYLASCLLCVWLIKDRVSKWLWLPLALTTLLFLTAIFFTKTRSVWVGAGSAVLLVLALTLKGRLRIGVLASIVAVAGIVGLVNFDSIVTPEREGSAADTRQSTDMRSAFAYVSWRMFQDKPLFGFGFGQFAREKLPYLGDRSVDIQLEEIRHYVHHNTFLSILTETGLVGLFFFLAVYVAWIRNAWALVRGANSPPWARTHGVLTLGVFAIAFWQMVGHEITFTPIDHSLIFFVAGVTTGLRQMYFGAAAPVSPQTALQPTPGYGQFSLR